MTLEILEEMEIVDAAHWDTKSRNQINRLIQGFWPGPLTLVLPKSDKIPDLVTSGLSTVAVRMPSHPLAQRLIQIAQRPLAAPSANRFGRISPTTAQAVAEELGDRIDWILEGGPCAIGVESTILVAHLNPAGPNFPKPEFSILRAGGTPKERLEEILGSQVAIASKQSSLDAPQAPGMLESHYAPRKPLFLLGQPLEKLTDSEISSIFKELSSKWKKLSPPFKIGVLLLSGEPESVFRRLSQLTPDPLRVKSLSPEGDLSEVAHRLFSEMRDLDASDASILVAEPCQAKVGLGFAITDRLQRASASYR
jgi:L-threonylcarbamoyladenylate synthase